MHPPIAVNVATFTLQNDTRGKVSETVPTLSAGDFRIAGGTFIQAPDSNGASRRLTNHQCLRLAGISSVAMDRKHFILANTVDATRTVNWNSGAGFVPIGAAGSSRFTGSLDGQSQTIAGLTIAPTETTHNIGLFGVIGSAGVVRDLNLTDVSVSAGPGARAVGTLAGVNHGTITNIYVTGNVDGGDAAGAWLGGLVGVNGGFGRPGSITAAAVNVGVSSAGSNVVLGGLAAFNSRYRQQHHARRAGRREPGWDLELGGVRRRRRCERCQPAGRRPGRRQFRRHPVVHRVRQRAGGRRKQCRRPGRVQFGLCLQRLHERRWLAVLQHRRHLRLARVRRRHGGCDERRRRNSWAPATA